MKEKIFIFLLIFCFIIAGFMPANVEKVGIVGTATADYVDASNNTSCIQPDPLVPGWSKDVRLTNASGYSQMPTVAIGSDNVCYLVWQDNRNGINYNLFFRKSLDCGLTWRQEKQIVTKPHNSKHPSLGIDDDGTLNLVWSYKGWISSEGGAEIMYKRSVDNGDHWSNETRLTHAKEDSFRPRIAVYHQILHVVWYDNRDGNFEIYYKKSEDNGEHWNEDVKLTNSSGISKLVSICVDSIGNIHLVWLEQQNGDRYSIYYMKGMNDGREWSTPKLLSSEGSVDIAAGAAKIVVDSHDALHVVWSDSGAQGASFEHVIYRKSANHRETWSSPVDLTKEFKSTDAFMPETVTDAKDNVYVIWKATNRSDNSNELYYIGKSIEGNDSSQINRLTHVVYGSRLHPTMIVDKIGYLHIMWYDQRDDDDPNEEIYYKRTLNPVTEPPITVTQSLNQTICKPGKPITVSGNAVYNVSIVPNADVTIKILETGDEWNTTTNTNGDYSKIITAPDTAGNYTIRVTITSGNHTGWKIMRLTVEQESTNGGTTNGGTTNGGQQPGGEENRYGINLNYVIGVVVIAVCVITGVVLVKRRGKTAAKTEKEKVEKLTMGLRCPKCRKTFRVEVKPKPFSVKCPYCGKEGTIK